MSIQEIDIGSGTMPISVEDESRVVLIDQRELPQSLSYFDATKFEDMLYAIKHMVVRGAPSIGVAGAFGLACYAVSIASPDQSTDDFLKQLDRARVEIQETRPPAVNLMWETDGIFAKARELVEGETELSPQQVAARLMEAAKQTMEDHVRMNRKLSEYGCDFIPKNPSILTHCNAGSLAACGWGTALGVIRSAKIRGYSPTVFVDETRPRSQGARLTMWELKEDGIPAKLICDSMAGYVMANKLIDLVIVGADRIAMNGDTANKIGTYNLAVLAKYHDIPFYVAAPLSTFDRGLGEGSGIPIEHRDLDEVVNVNGASITVEDAEAINPAFDVTPASLITAIFTEVGVLRPDYKESIARALA
ncbi:MAG TPA: S-methyl-5-thioribose-1-phosphate isomerase [Candidatus Melainabacteria bacterium]|nr:S-methyl-5-thioribose-1-phosphate isomerase [Candidatus Melainabacteria bacterium]